jgi:hypothetical protein
VQTAGRQRRRPPGIRREAAQRATADAHRTDVDAGAGALKKGVAIIASALKKPAAMLAEQVAVTTVMSAEQVALEALQELREATAAHWQEWRDGLVEQIELATVKATVAFDLAAAAIRRRAELLDSVVALDNELCRRIPAELAAAGMQVGSDGAGHAALTDRPRLSRDHDLDDLTKMLAAIHAHLAEQPAWARPLPSTAAR